MRLVARGFVYPFYALVYYARANVTLSLVYVTRRNAQGGSAFMQDTEHQYGRDNVTRFRWRNVARPCARETGSIRYFGGGTPSHREPPEKGLSELGVPVSSLPHHAQNSLVKKIFQAKLDFDTSRNCPACDYSEATGLM